MVRPVKSAEKQSAPVTPVVDVAAAAPKPRAKKAVKAETPVVVAPVAAEAPVATEAPVAEVSTVTVKMTEYSAKLQQLVGLLSTLKNDFKTLEKSVSREMKAAQKLSSKKRRNNGNRKPSGFVKPTRISDELAAFLGKTVGTEMARTEVSREINAYIQSNKLQDEKNGRKINPDAKLTQLLKLEKEDELTYFNLQRYMKHHFVKAEVAAVATA
jgi:vancomycin resistance protein YoaR